MGARFPVPDSVGGFFRQSCVHQDHIIPGINHIILQRSAIPDMIVKFLRAFLSAEGHALRIKTLFEILYCFDDHKVNNPPPHSVKSVRKRSCCSGRAALQVVPETLRFHSGPIMNHLACFTSQ